MLRLYFGVLCVLEVSIYIVAQETNKFPINFKFGVSTSAYQIEGGNAEAYGKGDTIWDHHIRKNPHIINNRSNANIACDSYHKYRNDIESLKFLGVHFYRFSLSWSRVLPDGHTVNVNALRFYNDVINLLVKNGIEPMVTLYHRDLPQRLQELGGWTNPYMAYYFEDYARLIFSQFGDRVKYWITFNSGCFGYGDDTEPPFVNQPNVANYLCQNVMLLAHAKVYHLYDQTFRRKHKGQIGVTIEKSWLEPATDKSEDIKAAERARHFTLGLQANAIYHPEGDYPEIVKRRVAEISKKQGYIRSRLPEMSKEEVEYIQGTYDFFGLNYYTTTLVAETNSSEDDVGVRMFQKDEWPRSASNWLRVNPKGLRSVLRWIKKTYDNPDIIITENGFSDYGQNNDTERIDYLKRHLQVLLDAINEDQIPVKGYAIWSLMDNFEWMKGYSERFGLFHVNFNDPRRTRTKKLSARWFKEVIAKRTPNITKFV